MHLHCLGINYKTAGVSVREHLTFNSDSLRVSLSRLGCGHSGAGIFELVILSTCNRVEFYAISESSRSFELEELLSELRNVPMSDFHPLAYHYLDQEVIRHLLRVVAGLDSLVLGEPQILWQVTDAFSLAREAGSVGPLLSRLFLRAIHAGKRTRAETLIGHNPASVSSLAASLVERFVRDLTSAQLVILGAGEMAELAVESLRKRGAARVLVLNRTLERAQHLAERWQAQASTFEQLDRSLVNADVMISSTGAPHTIISSHMVRKAMSIRPDRPLVLIDIAVPRDIESDCSQIPNVTVLDMDDLHDRLEISLAEREAEIPMVEAILEEEARVIVDFFNSLDVLPVIADLRQKAELIRQAELKKTLRRLPDLNEAERARIDALTQALVKKLLDAPTHCLKDEANKPAAPEYASMARAMFGLTPLE